MGDVGDPMKKLLSSPGFASAAIVVVALTLRVLYFQQIQTSPFFEQPIYDARDYASWAAEIADGNLLWDEFRLYPPGYPFFLAGLSRLTGHHWFAMTFANALLGCGWILLLVSGLRRRLPRPAAEIAGVVAATYWVFFHFEAHLLATTWFTFLLVLAFWLFTRLDPAPAPERRPWWLAAAGLAIGVAAITRPNALLSLPFLLWFAATKDEGSLGRRLVRTWPVVAAVVAVTLPVMVRNHQLSGMFALRHHMAINLYLGNRPDAPGYHTVRPGRDWDRLSWAPEQEGGVHGLPAHERWFRDRVVEFALDDPAAFAGLQLRKLGLFFHERELRVIMSPYFFERWAPLQGQPWWPDFGWVGPLAIVGLGLGIFAQSRPWLLWAFAVPQGLIIVLTVVGSRYRLPVVPFLIAFAAYALVRIGTWVRRRRWGPAAASLAAVAAATTIVHRDLAEPGGFGEELARVAFVYEERGDFDEAARWWVESFREDPARIESYVDYAALALRVGDPARAADATARGLALAPADADLLELRGRALLRLERPDSAAVALTAALALRPDDADLLADLGRVLYDLGRSEESLDAFRGALRLRTDDPDLLLDAAHVLAAEGQIAAARGLLDRVLVLDPEHTEARERLANLPEPPGR
jgi:Flp pilus assembly protein TadD